MPTQSMMAWLVPSPAMSPRMSAGLYTNTVPTSVSSTRENTSIAILVPLLMYLPTSSGTPTPPFLTDIMPTM